jgi:hypothetical protein
VQKALFFASQQCYATRKVLSGDAITARLEQLKPGVRNVILPPAKIITSSQSFPAC